MSDSLVDVVIPVHTELRPIANAVESVLNHNSAPVRAIVVAHNIDSKIIEKNLGSWARDPRVTIVPHSDGISSPAGPFNAGIAAGSAPFFTFLGSDDEFEPGAIDSWLDVQRSSDAAVVIVMIRHEGGNYDASPPVRPIPRPLLDPVKDRLPYRSAPLALISRSHFGHLRFSVGVPSGEDLAYVMQMWFSGERITIDRTGPAYFGRPADTGRVSTTPRTIDADFMFLNEIIASDWYKKLARAERRAMAVKFLRMQVLDAIVNRKNLQDWTPDDAQALAKEIQRVLGMCPRVAHYLSVADWKVVDHALRTKSSPTELTAMMGDRWNLHFWKNIVPINPFLLLHSQGPLKTLYASRVLMAVKAI